MGTITLFVAMLVMMLVFDWRMGAACLLAAVISIVAMFSMMGGKNAQILGEYQAALDRITKAGTEYVRGIPVVKIYSAHHRPRAPTGSVFPSYMTVSCQKSNVISSWFMLAPPVLFFHFLNSIMLM